MILTILLHYTVHNEEVKNILDQLIPARTVTCRQRPSDPLFDDARQLERTANKASGTAAADAKMIWHALRNSCRKLLRHKRESFWQDNLQAERSSPWQLWQSIVTLMRCGVIPKSPSFTVIDFHVWLDDNVVNNRAATASATASAHPHSPPYFIYHCATGNIFNIFINIHDHCFFTQNFEGGRLVLRPPGSVHPPSII